MLATGTKLGRYRIEMPLGRGGMGEVYRAQDTVLLRPVALKVLRRDKLEDAGPESRHEAQHRFEREARAAAALQHPNVVTIYDVGRSDGVLFIAMELVDGRPLRWLVGDSDASLDLRIGWLVQIARALDAAHRRGLVHRDIKPDNVIVGRDDVAKVLDFGMAKWLAPEPRSSAHSVFETVDGRVLGTPKYMAPEQLARGAPDPKWDQYAWGATAYELLSRVHPRETLRAPPVDPWTAPTEPPAPLHELAPEVPRPICDAVMRALELAPAARWSSMRELLAVFGAATRGPALAPPQPALVASVGPSSAAATRVAPPSRGSRAWIAALGGVALAATCIAAVGLARSRPATADRASSAHSAQLVASHEDASSPIAEALVDAGAHVESRVSQRGRAVASARALVSSEATADAPTVPFTPRPGVAYATLGGACGCLNPSGGIDDYNLCPLERRVDPPVCNCASKEGYSVCQAPRSASGECADSLWRAKGSVSGQSCAGTIGALGDPSSVRAVTGTLHCRFCDGSYLQFKGSPGDPCIGLDGHGRVVEGKLRCR